MEEMQYYQDIMAPEIGLLNMATLQYNIIMHLKNIMDVI